MDFEKLTSEQIEINMLKSKLENMDSRVQFLEKNWVHWTKSILEEKSPK